MTTIREVAKLAGVSVATVSRTLNNSGYVSESTRKKVEKAVSLREHVFIIISGKDNNTCRTKIKCPTG